MRFPLLPLVLGVALLNACATPRADLPNLSSELVAEKRAEVQRLAVADALDREERVLRLAWPILTENAELCRDTAPRLGWRIGDADTIRGLADGLKKRQIEALGYDERPRVLSVAPGSPAAAAGIEPGDQILSVGSDEEAKDLRGLGEQLDKALDDDREDRPIAVRYRRDGQVLGAEVEAQDACAVRVVSSGSGAINASASFATMRVYAGLIRALPEDNDLAFVIAHELAHIAGRHPRKVIRNGIVSGAFVWGPPALILADVTDRLISRPAEALGSEAPPASTAVTRLAAASVGSVSFEEEADYVGLYMHMRAGGSPEGLENVFELFARVSPRTSWLKVTHPTVPERLLRLEATEAEIDAKLEAGDPLQPEGWTIADES